MALVDRRLAVLCVRSGVWSWRRANTGILVTGEDVKIPLAAC